VRNQTVSIAFAISIAVHLSAIIVGAVALHKIKVPTQELLRVNLIEMPRYELPRPQTPPSPENDAPAETKKPPPPKVEKPNETKPVIKKEPLPANKVEVAKPAPPPALSAAIEEDPAKAIGTKPTAPPSLEPPPSFSSSAKSAGGGSETGAGNLFGEGDVGVIPGSGTAGGGTAALGSGRGYGAPGVPGQSVLRTNREAKAIQTVRAAYPPMALRMGMESDVTLKIEIDTDGKVTKAEIVKSGGAGFDEEALKAVKQSRFEPAQRDGQPVAAEFSYIYRFRLQR
jgi:protein TonB